jgi:hypothetical protein
MRAVLLSLGLLMGPLSGVAAQEGASLSEVELLMAQGQIMEARETLESWWNLRFDSADRSNRQKGFWLRGRLTVDPSIAELDYRRLILEFPGGPYSDDALFRVGLASANRGELRAAQSAFQRLVRDYPSSPRLGDARTWLRTHSGEIDALPVPPAPPPPEPPPETRTLPDEGNFSVQLGAFRSLERAQDLAGELREDGYPARVVRSTGNDLARVRTGRFSSRLRAEALARELSQRGYEVTLITDAGSEERIGRAPTRVGQDPHPLH